MPPTRLLPLLGLLATIACAAASRATPAAAARPPARTVLFVGNSFTFGAAAGGPDLVQPFGAGTVTDLNGEGIGGVPALFEAFTRQAGLDYDVSVETRPGAGLDFHYRERLPLVNRAWDVVVLQSYSTLDAERPGDPAKLVTYAALLADSLVARNPRVAIHLVATWSRADLTYQPSGNWYGKPIDAMARDVEAGYESARARARNVAGVIPVGAAWSRAIAAGIADANPYDGVDTGTVNLWAPDAYHASVFGYYLEALVDFGAITGVDPRTLGAGEEAARALGITPAQATALQAVAHEALAARARAGAPSSARPARHAQSGPGCAPNDARAALIAGRIAFVLVDTSESIRELRAAAGLSGLGVANVELVADTTVCNRARGVLNSRQSIATPGVAPTVFRLAGAGGGAGPAPTAGGATQCAATASRGTLSGAPSTSCGPSSRHRAGRSRGFACGPSSIFELVQAHAEHTEHGEETMVLLCVLCGSA